MAAKVDLHLPSRFSDRSVEWMFRRFEFPDSYSDPRSLYRRVREKGMSLVTFPDHNRIDGCLEIADQPDTFVSCEVTAEFPEDQVAVHILVWNITELEHREIQQIRRNLYELQAYLANPRIVHAIAHPFYDKDRRLTSDHVQKLVLLLQHFEGCHERVDSFVLEVARVVLRSLPPELIEKFADRQKL